MYPQEIPWDKTAIHLHIYQLKELKKKCHCMVEFEMNAIETKR